jgi:hypothetical protein
MARRVDHTGGVMGRAASLHWGGGARQGALHFGAPVPGAGLDKVICIGEGGVDRAALQAAQVLGYKAGGCGGKGANRAALNVRDADATLIVYNGTPGKGTRETEEIAHRLGKPVMAVDLADRGGFDRAQAWLKETSPRVLNVAGAGKGRDVGVYARSYAMLVRLLGPAPVPREG